MINTSPLKAGALALAAACAGFVSTATQARSITIATSDLDLGTAKGRNALDRRIARASVAVCSSGAGHLDAGVRHSERLCREVTIRAAQSQVAHLHGPRLASR